MSNEQLDTLKLIIQTRLKELASRTFDRDIDCDGDEGDEVQGLFLLNMAYECNDRNNMEFNLLNNAMQKFPKNEYGLCEECDCDIEYKRLLVCPGARHCIKCAELIEKENRNYKSGRIS